MPRKIDVLGLFIDPETIIDLQLQKRISVYYPVFQELAQSKSIFKRSASPDQHIVRFDHQEPYGIIMTDKEQPDPASFAVTYAEAAIEKLLKDLRGTGKQLRNCHKIN